MRGYAICTERRSGSVLLCHMLRSTGVLGYPVEYFNPDAIRSVFGVVDYPADPEDQLAAILKMGATPNGVYGVKLFADHFDTAKATRWAERLPSLSFIHLVRIDVLGQAISNVRALQTQQWVSSSEAKGQPAYDFETINRMLRGLLRAQNRWRYYLARNGVPVLHLNYEQMCQAPQETVEAVGRLMGLAEKPRLDASKVTAKVQRDGLNEEWRARYLSEARDLTIF